MYNSAKHSCTARNNLPEASCVVEPGIDRLTHIL